MNNPPQNTNRNKPRFYYGWFIVFGYLLSGIAGSGAILWGFQVFVNPMAEDLGWSKSTIFSITVFRTVIMGVLLIFLSRLMDQKKWPPIVMSISSEIFALSIMALGSVNEYWQYFLFAVVFGSIGLAGAGGQLYQALVPKWFVKYRGKAIAFGSAGTALGAFIYPTLANILIDAYGWRLAWVIVGIITLILLLPISLLIRRSPEDLGLLPDGELLEISSKAQKTPSPASSKVQEISFTPKEALKQRSTWFIVLATMLVTPTMVGLTSNWAIHFQSIGFTRTEAATIVSTYGASSLAARLAWGIFLDKYHIRTLAIVHAALTAGSIGFLLFVESFGLIAILYGVTQGLILGGYLAIGPLIWANFFGRNYLGAIRGTFAPFQTIMAATAPWAIAAAGEAFGTYRYIFMILLTFWILSMLCMYLARPLKPINNEAKS